MKNFININRSNKTFHNLPDRHGDGNEKDRVLVAIRFFALAILILGAAGVISGVFMRLTANEWKQFDLHARVNSGKIISSFSTKAGLSIDAFASFESTLKAYVRYSNSSWPTVTMPHFEETGRAVIKLASVISLMLVPVVQETEREIWETFARETQGWIAESLAAQELSRDAHWTEPTNWSQSLGKIPETIVTVGFQPETAPGPYTPTWQIVPMWPMPSFKNYNLISNTKLRSVITSAIESGNISLSRTYVPVDLSKPEEERKTGVLGMTLQKWEDYGNQYLNDPVSDLMYPIHDEKDGKMQVVAFFKCFIYWRTYFQNTLEEGAGPFIVVLQSDCGDVHSYEVLGPEPQFLGEGDHHDREYDDMVEFHTFDDPSRLHQNVTTSEDHGGFCRYRISVYPSKDVERKFITSSPRDFALVIAAVFAFTSIVFTFYDLLVQRRQRTLSAMASRSGALVSTLFPKNFHDRVYKSSFAQRAMMSGTESNDITDDLSPPIADLFDECSVFFGDLAGFTAWCDNRDPPSVFFLLESIYRKFDSLCRSVDVFKVETIGDCYVCVTGLPDPQSDHAILMARFACEAQIAIREMLPALALRLGQDTAQLRLRVGLHTGAVTAGVLRGDRQRFQLYGDAVNFAARMEQSGKPGEIQCSTAMAALLQPKFEAAFEAREDLVELKGKGCVQTYMLDFEKFLALLEDDQACNI